MDRETLIALVEERQDEESFQAAKRFSIRLLRRGHEIEAEWPKRELARLRLEIREPS
jgi:hypothetical protein